MMRAYLIISAVLISQCLKAQDESPSNSFESRVRKTNPLLKYEYDSLTQTHNYSGNWDFDGDGEMDQLHFVGTGGAHLYYYPRIILTTKGTVKEYKEIQLDFPMLTAQKPDQKSVFLKGGMIGFAIFDSDKDHRSDIYIHLDTQSKTLYSEKNPSNLSSVLIITFEGALKVKGWT